MNKISEIISKQVISLYDAKVVGTIENVVLDNKFSKLKSFIIFDDNTQIKKELNFKDIFNFNGENFVIKNSQKLKDIIIFENYNNPINKEVICLDGKSLGKIKEIEFNNNLIVNLSLNNGEIIQPNNIISIGEIIVVNLDDIKVKKSNFAPKNNRKNINLNEIKVQIQNLKPLQIVPPRFSATSFIGKTANKNILGYNNEVLLKKGEVITKNALDKIKLHNKLVELF